jgi:hypothetical protein
LPFVSMTTTLSVATHTFGSVKSLQHIVISSHCYFLGNNTIVIIKVKAF